MPSDLNETLYGARANPRPLEALEHWDTSWRDVLEAERRPDGVWEVVLELEEHDG